MAADSGRTANVSFQALKRTKLLRLRCAIGGHWQDLQPPSGEVTTPGPSPPATGSAVRRRASSPSPPGAWGCSVLHLTLPPLPGGDVADDGLAAGMNVHLLDPRRPIATPQRPPSERLSRENSGVLRKVARWPSQIAKRRQWLEPMNASILKLGSGCQVLLSACLSSRLTPRQDKTTDLQRSCWCSPECLCGGKVDRSGRDFRGSAERSARGDADAVLSLFPLARDRHL
jgi:hypothetical protein